MIMYGIESVKGKKNKRLILLIIILAIILVVAAIFAGIKVAQYSNLKKQAQNQKEENSLIENNQNNEEQIEQKEDGKFSMQGKNKDKLSEEQIEKINHIYNAEEKVAYLTFDDGPSSTVTPKILETLKKEEIRATFFVLGTMVKSNPEILKQERQDGHYIANHGYSHVYKKIYADSNKPLEEYNKTNELIQKALGEKDYQSNVFRFPGGSVGGYYDKIKTKAKKVFKENGIAYLDWNALTNDSDGANTKEAILKNLKSTCKGKNSVVILMHDAPNKSLTAETLPDVIAYLKEQKYSFRTLYDVI